MIRNLCKSCEDISPNFGLKYEKEMGCLILCYVHPSFHLKKVHLTLKEISAGC